MKRLSVFVLACSLLWAWRAPRGSKRARLRG